MPHIRVRGMKPAQVQELSLNLPEELATIVATSADNFTIEHVPSQFFVAGQPDVGYPMVEILWFERPANVRQQTADHVTKRVKVILPNADVSVVFQSLEKSSYFENGRHF